MYMHSYQNSSSDKKLMNCFVCSNLWNCYKYIILEDDLSGCRMSKLQLIRMEGLAVYPTVIRIV